MLSRRFDDSYCPTIEDYHIKLFKIKSEFFRLEILDTAGNDPFPAVHKLNIMSGDVFVLPFSLDDIDSFNQVKNLCQEIRELKKVNRKTNFPILILGNKLDTIKDSKTRCVDAATIELLLSSMKSCIYAETSCRTTRGLDEAFQKVFTMASMPIEMLPAKHRRILLNFEQSKSSHLPVPVGEIRTNRLMAFKESHGNNTNNNISLEPPSEGSQKSASKKRLTFRRNLMDARGVAHFNVRRPSIQTELNNLQKKTNVKRTKDMNKPQLESFMHSLRKLMCLKFKREHTGKNFN